jgi:hypothetical protein
MKLNDVGVVIARRELALAGGQRVTVIVGKPEPFPDTPDFYCPYQILGLGPERVRYAGGVDGVQALELTLKMIGADLYTSNEAKAKELTWMGSANLGFPVPDSIKDLPPTD